LTISFFKHKKIQKQISAVDKKNGSKKTEKAMQAGARKYPERPVAKQHLSKPGLEKKLVVHACL
jgi:hypothetical protein